MAGGVRQSLADKVIVIRQIEGSEEPITFELSLKDAKKDSVSNVLLADGDVVSVEETPLTFAVGTLRDTVRFALNGTSF